MTDKPAYTKEQLLEHLNKLQSVYKSEAGEDAEECSKVDSIRSLLTAQPATGSDKIATKTAMEEISAEIIDIVAEYRRQQENGYVDTPGGIEHKGDAFNLLCRWEKKLNPSPPPTDEAAQGVG